MPPSPSSRLARLPHPLFQHNPLVGHHRMYEASNAYHRIRVQSAFFDLGAEIKRRGISCSTSRGGIVFSPCFRYGAWVSVLGTCFYYYSSAMVHGTCECAPLLTRACGCDWVSSLFTLRSGWDCVLSSTGSDFLKCFSAVAVGKARNGNCTQLVV